MQRSYDSSVVVMALKRRGLENIRTSEVGEKNIALLHVSSPASTCHCLCCSQHHRHATLSSHWLKTHEILCNVCVKMVEKIKKRNFFKKKKKIDGDCMKSMGISKGLAQGSMRNNRKWVRRKQKMERKRIPGIPVTVM